MKFLLDVCVSSRSLEAVLTQSGHDVLSALNVNPKASLHRRRKDTLGQRLQFTVAQTDEEFRITAHGTFPHS